MIHTLRNIYVEFFFISSITQREMSETTTKLEKASCLTQFNLNYMHIISSWNGKNESERQS